MKGENIPGQVQVEESYKKVNFVVSGSESQSGSKILSPWVVGYTIVDSDIGLSYRPAAPGYMGWPASTTTLCQSRLHTPSQELRIWPLESKIRFRFNSENLLLISLFNKTKTSKINLIKLQQIKYKQNAYNIHQSSRVRYWKRHFIWTEISI